MFEIKVITTELFQWYLCKRKKERGKVNMVRPERKTERGRTLSTEITRGYQRTETKNGWSSIKNCEKWGLWMAKVLIQSLCLQSKMWRSCMPCPKREMNSPFYKEIAQNHPQICCCCLQNQTRPNAIPVCDFIQHANIMESDVRHVTQQPQQQSLSVIIHSRKESK